MPVGTQAERMAKLENKTDTQEKGTLLKSIFDVHNVKSAFTTALKKRENKRRTYIIAIGWFQSILIKIL